MFLGLLQDPLISNFSFANLETSIGGLSQIKKLSDIKNSKNLVSVGFILVKNTLIPTLNFQLHSIKNLHKRKHLQDLNLGGGLLIKKLKFQNFGHSFLLAQFSQALGQKNYIFHLFLQTYDTTPVLQHSRIYICHEIHFTGSGPD